MATDPFLRLNEIINHMISLINQYQDNKQVPTKTLDLMEQELFEAKKISNVIEHESKELKEIKEKMNWVEKEIKLLKKKK